jgi:hypothetical protein
LGLLILTTICFQTCRNADYPAEKWNLWDLHPPANAKFYQVSSADTTGGNNDRINIMAGDSATIFEAEGPGYLSRIWFTVDSRDPHFLRRILIRMYWDDESDPSVEVPLGDFFGSAFAYKHHTPLLIGMSSGGYYCYFPMPFNRKARIEIVNQTGEEVYAFYYQIGYYVFQTPMAEGTPYFHATWTRSLRTTNQNENFTALDASGSGYFVGLHYNAQSYDRRLVYLEGDEMVYVDGETEPSIKGTGMEDYFNSGWYFQDGTYDAAYHGLVLMDTLGRISAYRHHWPDAIPFSKSIQFTLEHGHGNEEIVDLSTTAFWYQTEPHKLQDPIPVAGLRVPLQQPVPNFAIEAEQISIQGASGALKDMSQFGSDWSGAIQLELISENPFELKIPGMKEEAYDVSLYLSQGPGYGDFSISDGKGQSVIHRGEASDLRMAPVLNLSSVTPKNDTLTVFIVPKVSGNKTQAKMGLDAVLVTPVRSYIPEWYIIGPFPNRRLSDDLRFGLDSIYPPEQEYNPAATYAGVDQQPVRWKRISGAQGGYSMGLGRLFNPREFIISYAQTQVYSPENQTVSLFIGSDDGAKVFLNDEEVYRFLAVRTAAPDQDTVKINLKKGWNRLMIKAENNFGGYAFYVRILDLQKNLKFDIDAVPDH